MGALRSDSNTTRSLPPFVQAILWGLPWTLLVVGLIALQFCVQHLRERDRLETEGVKTTRGVVWATSVRRPFQLEVLYEDKIGHEWRNHFTVFSDQYRKGQAVDVIYLSSRPMTAMLGPAESGETRGQYWEGAGVGMIALLISGTMLWLRRSARVRA